MHAEESVYHLIIECEGYEGKIEVLVLEVSTALGNDFFCKMENG